MFSLFSSRKLSRPLNPHRPNLLEVTGTTIPLLSTVLAGFVVTIITQLLTQSEASQAGTLLHIGLTLLAISFPFFLAATSFAVWAQSYNYLILTSDVKELMNFDISKQQSQRWKDYLDASHTIWQKWYGSALIFYYIGLILFVVGVNFLFLRYIGKFAVISVYAVLSLVTICGFILDFLSNKIRK